VDHEINFAEFELLAGSFGCSFDELHRAVEVLSHPDGGMLSRVFVRKSRTSKAEVDPGEVASRGRAFYVDEIVSREEWSQWSKGIQVVWRLRQWQTSASPSK